MNLVTFLVSLCLGVCSNLRAQSELAPLPADGFVTLETIVDDFAKSLPDALQKYNGMRVCVYGRVDKITQKYSAGESSTALLMKSSLAQNINVNDLFNKAYISSGSVILADSETEAVVHSSDWTGNVQGKSSPIVSGEIIAVRGFFDNFVSGDIILKNCFKLGAEGLDKKLTEHGITAD